MSEKQIIDDVNTKDVLFRGRIVLICQLVW
jgi:hypothetical protein